MAGRFFPIFQWIPRLLRLCDHPFFDRFISLGRSPGRQVDSVCELRGFARCVRVPVAILCKALRAIGVKDVGTGGFDGFFGGDVQEVRYHSGGHSAMFSDANLISMLEFLFDRSSRGTPAPLKPDATVMRLWSNATPVITFCLLSALALGVLYCAAQFGWCVAAGFFIVFAIVLLVPFDLVMAIAISDSGRDLRRQPDPLNCYRC